MPSIFPRLEFGQGGKSEDDNTKARLTKAGSFMDCLQSSGNDRVHKSFENQDQLSKSMQIFREKSFQMSKSSASRLHTEEKNRPTTPQKKHSYPRSPREGKLTRMGSINENVNSDRFVPRGNSFIDAFSSQINLRDTTDRGQLKIIDPEKVTYQEEVAKACGVILGKRILAFNSEESILAKQDLKTIWKKPRQPYTRVLIQRKIKTEPERILDAPSLSDDYYLNLLDWSSKNKIAIGLEDSIYIWDGDTGVSSKLLQTEDDSYVTSLRWSCDGAYLSVGSSKGHIEIWSIEECKKLRTMYGHTARVGVISWDRNILSSGGKDSVILNHDVRIAVHNISSFNFHESDVCGLTWGADGKFLASGGNDNQVAVWDPRSTVPVMTKSDHVAAVKALAWCPWQKNTLVTGGGSYDKKMMFWNVSTGANISSVDTGSQITSIFWSQEHKELFTAHGFPNNHMSLWKYPSLKSICDLPGHETRVLHAALSPDRQRVATAACDGSLKFWLIWENQDSKKRFIKKSASISKLPRENGLFSGTGIGMRLALR